jgi:hypothetical protein
MPEPPVMQDESKVLPRVQQILELLSKSWVVIAALIYGSGYVVVSIYHASLGLNEVNVLNPRVAASGLLFFALLAMAIYLLRYSRSLIFRFAAGLPNLRRWVFIAVVGAFFVLNFDFIAIGLISKIFYFEGSQPFPKLFPSIMLPSVLLFSVVVFCHNTDRAPKWVTHWITVLCCGLFLISFAIMSRPVHQQFGIRQAAWIVALFQVIWVSTSNALTVEELRRNQNWFQLATEWLVPLLLYCVLVYPHVRGAYGGGEATAAKMFLTTATGGGNTKQIPVRIIDETDNGFYVTEGGHKEVRFIPRSQINSIEFDKPASLFLSTGDSQ